MLQRVHNGFDIHGVEISFVIKGIILFPAHHSFLVVNGGVIVSGAHTTIIQDDILDNLLTKLFVTLSLLFLALWWKRKVLFGLACMRNLNNSSDRFNLN